MKNVLIDHMLCQKMNEWALDDQMKLLGKIEWLEMNEDETYLDSGNTWQVVWLKVKQRQTTNTKTHPLIPGITKLSLYGSDL